MGNLTQQTLNAPDCNKLIISMWFELPGELPGSLTGQHDSRFHSYTMMEFGGYKQAPETVYYPDGFEIAVSLGYGEIPPWLDPDHVSWNFPSTGTVTYIGDIITAVFVGEPFGEGGQHTGSGIPPEVEIDKNEKLGRYELQRGEVSAVPGNYQGGFEQAWGLKTPRGVGSITDTYGLPSAPEGGSGTSSELWYLRYTPFETTYYGYQAPSTIWIAGGGFSEDDMATDGGDDDPTDSVTDDGGGGPSAEKSMSLNVRIAGTLLELTSDQNQSSTVIPSLNIRVPDHAVLSPTFEGVPGDANHPYVTVGKWHHMLCCVDLNGANMVEPTEEGDQVSVAENVCTMWVLLDGVAYGGKRWPPEGHSVTIEEHEVAPVEYVYPPSFPVNYLPLEDTDTGRKGILVNGSSIHIPYNPKWTRFNDDWDINVSELSSVFGEEPYYFDTPVHGDVHGWKPLDQGLQIPLTYTAGHSLLLPSDPNPALQWQTPTNLFEPKTVDIKRKYHDVQIWFGKYIDPTKYENLKLFLEITRDDDGDLVGNPPILDQAAKDAYAAAKLDDANTKVLSLAAAPNHLGQPDVYLHGGASSFIHDKGKEGDTFVKVGTIKDTPKPVDIPIPASAVKPTGL